MCEACSTAVSSEELDEGRASEIYGVVLCGRCGGGEEARSENRVELYFCDRCHVSVPVYRVDTGEALAGDGRILCLDCRAGMPRRRLPRWTLVAAAILLAVGGMRLIDLQNRKEPPETPESAVILESLDRQLKSLAQALGETHTPGGLDGILTGLESLERAAEERTRSLGQAQAALERLREDFDRRLQEMAGEAGALHERLDGLMLEAVPER